MPKLPNETDLEYKRRVIDIKSASFCAAKWYNATIWLGSGQTTSCHHPLPHAIDVEAIKTNPSAIHNTPRKKGKKLNEKYIHDTRADFYRFFHEYDQRRGLSFEQTFPQMKEFWQECKWHAENF